MFAVDCQFERQYLPHGKMHLILVGIHPGMAQAAPRQHPGSTQAAPRHGPGSTQAAPRHGPGMAQNRPSDNAPFPTLPLKSLSKALDRTLKMAKKPTFDPVLIVLELK